MEHSAQPNTGETQSSKPKLQAQIATDPKRLYRPEEKASPQKPILTDWASI